MTGPLRYFRIIALGVPRADKACYLEQGFNRSADGEEEGKGGKR
jgi:hypothetical protein